jgi:hypothetical protein
MPRTVLFQTAHNGRLPQLRFAVPTLAPALYQWQARSSTAFVDLPILHPASPITSSRRKRVSRYEIKA